MGSKFENFDIGRAVAKFLKTKDPKNFPTELNTDQLQPVICVGSFGTIPDRVAGLAAGVILDNLSAFVQDIVLPNPGGLLPPNANLDTLIMGIELDISYNAAGAIADNGKVMSVAGSWTLNLANPVTVFDFIISRNFTVATGQQRKANSSYGRRLLSIEFVSRVGGCISGKYNWKYFRVGATSAPGAIDSLSIADLIGLYV
jgi:hypothetical protein